MSVNGALVEDKMSRFKGECVHFSFKKCPIYTHDSASAKFRTISSEIDNSVVKKSYLPQKVNGCPERDCRKRGIQKAAKLRKHALILFLTASTVCSSVTDVTYVPNSTWPEIIKLFPARESLLSDVKIANLFYSVGQQTLQILTNSALKPLSSCS